MLSSRRTRKLSSRRNLKLSSRRTRKLSLAALVLALSPLAARAARAETANLALGKPATQSTTAVGGVASRAVDGNTDGNWGNGSVTHTADAGWWQVDLQSVQRIGDVVLFNRTDCCSERLQNFELLVSNDGNDWQSFPHPGIAGSQVSFPVNRAARYVRVQARNGIHPLSLAEVKVFAAPNLALGKPATQSSTDWGGVASRAVDGNTDGNWGSGSVTHTADPGWWQVDLESAQTIGDVVLYNRTDCCADRLQNFTLLVSDDATTWQSYAHPGVAGSQVTLSVRRSARYVKVQLNNNNAPLSLAEVQVFPGQPRATDAQGRGGGVVPGCGDGQEYDAGLCYSPCAAGYHGVGPMCWPDAQSYGRGAGTVPTSCGAGKDLDAGLCYPTCADGYHGVGPVCWQICAPGYTEFAGVCWGWWSYFQASYGRGAGTVPTVCDPGNELDAGLCYPTCTAGYHGVGPVCWPDAQAYGRGAGTVPDACSGGMVKDAGLCYPACGAGYHGVGPVCWGDAITPESILSAGCAALYDPVVTEIAQLTGQAHTFGFGAGIAAGASAGAEVGVAYGPEGEFGCYVTVCGGFTTGASIEAWASFGMSMSYDGLGGDSIVTSAGISVEIPETPLEVGGSLGIETSLDGEYQGFSVAASFGAGASPLPFVEFGQEICHTELLDVTSLLPEDGE